MDTTSGDNGRILGAAIDAPASRRPGVPMEAEPRHRIGAAHWTSPERQPDPGNILKRKGLDDLTPVFGTTLPPRGISGAMRRAAYEIPEHHSSHWLVLLLADRVDAIEHEPRKALSFALFTLATSGLLALALGVGRRRTD
jgi:hypothetical protein